MRRSDHRPDPIAVVLDRVFQRLEPQECRGVYRIWFLWSEVVGNAVAAHAQPSGYHGGILSVRVDSHVWMQELQFLKEEIRHRLNERLGAERVRDIYFVFAGGPFSARSKTRAPTPAATRDPAEPPVSLPPLRDPRLVEVFERLARAHAQRGRTDPMDEDSERGRRRFPRS